MADKVLELGTFEETRDGVPHKYKIMTVPEEIFEEVIDHMIKNFMPREPLCSHNDLANDPVAVELSRTIWRSILRAGAAMVAIAERPGPLKDRILGANLTYITYKDKHSDMPELVGKFKNVYLGCQTAADRANIYERYGVDKYLSAFGLSVDAAYHGYRIGERLLQCRKPLCEHFGIKVTGTIYTPPSSQYLAKKVGFKVLYEDEYSNFRSDEGELYFEGLEGKFEYSALVYD